MLNSWNGFRSTTSPKRFIFFIWKRKHWTVCFMTLRNTGDDGHVSIFILTLYRVFNNNMHFIYSEHIFSFFIFAIEEIILFRCLFRCKRFRNENEYKMNKNNIYNNDETKRNNNFQSIGVTLPVLMVHVQTAFSVLV